MSDREPGEASSWDDHAAAWDDDPAAVAYSRAVFDSLERTLRDRHRDLTGMRVLDFGCGTGLLTEQLTDRVATVDAVDTSPLMLEVLDRKVERLGWTHVRTARQLPPGGGSHDLIVASSVCSFLDDYPATVADLVTRLRPGGLFVQWDWESDPGEDDADADGDGDGDREENGHGLRRDQIDAALAAAGLIDVHVDTGFCVSVDGVEMAPLVGIGATPG